MRAALLALLLLASPASAQAWLPGFALRQPLDVTVASPVSDYQLLVVLDTTGRTRPGCPDLRFTATDGTTVLPHWLESGCGTASTRLWVRVPQLAATARGFVYFGHPTAPDVSSGAATHLFFDQFEVDPEATGRWYDVHRALGNTAAEWVWSDAGFQLVTDNFGSVGGGATFAQLDGGWDDAWAVSFRYRIGGGGASPGDGLAFGFFHEGNAGSGNELGVNKAGYAVELDAYQGPGDVSAQHLAVVETFPGADVAYTHFDRFDTAKTVDDQWHAVVVEMFGSRLTVSLDDAGVIDHTRSWSTANKRLLFGAGTGGSTDAHRLDDVILRRFVRPEPSIAYGALERYDAGSGGGAGGGSGGSGGGSGGNLELELVTAQPKLPAGTLSELITVKLKSGTAGSDLDVTLKSSSGRSGFVVKTSDKISQPLTVTIPTGSSSTGFYYQDFAEGAATVTASAPGFTSSSISFEIAPAEKQGCGCGSAPLGLAALALLSGARRRRAGSPARATRTGRSPRPK